MPPKKRKVSFSPVEEHISSPPTKKRSYNKKIPAATAATSRPKRGEAEESVKKTNSTPSFPLRGPRKKTGNVGRPKSKSTTSTPSRPGASLSTPPVTAKRGRGRPKKVVDDGGARTSETPSANVPIKPQDETEKKRGRGRPKKIANESNFVKGTAALEPQVSTKSQEEIEDFAVDYGKDDLQDNRSYWLMKSEPEARFVKGLEMRFSIDDLRKCQEPEPWEGVRNPAARNNMRAMRKGDYAFFYHSNCKDPGIAGIMEIVQEHTVDKTAFDTSHPYHDSRSDPNHPKWDLVHVEFRHKFKKLVGLAEMKSYGKPGGALENLQTLKQSRLSVSAVTAKQWKFIMSLVGEDDGDGQENGKL